MTTFSSDILTVDDAFPLIGEMYFRIKADSVDHNRTVFGIVDWLGAVGGIRDILFEFIAFLFGGYIQFNAVIQAYEFLCNG